MEDARSPIGRALDTVVDSAAAGEDPDAADPGAGRMKRLLAEVDALRRWANEHAGRHAMEGLLKKALAALSRLSWSRARP